MYFKFTTLSFLAAVVMSAVSATVAADNSVASSNIVATDAADPRAGLLTAAKRSYLSRKKIASVLQRRNESCDHRNHRTYQRGDDYKRPRLHRIESHRCGGDLAHCGDSDSDEYEHRYEHDNEYDEDDFEYDFDDDEDYYDCDECDACDEDGFRYLSWEDYNDEITK